MRRLMRVTHSSFGTALLLCCALISGCAVAPPQATYAGPNAACREVFRLVDQAVAEAGVQDGMAARVAGFPYLRASRFLASYAGEELNDTQFAEWLGRMKGLATRSYEIELSNLPAANSEGLVRALRDLGGEYARPAPALAECARLLAAADRADPARRSELRHAVSVPDDYVTWQRIVGLYWLTRVPFANGIRNWHEDVRAVFAQPVEALPVTGELKAYALPPGRMRAADLAALFERISANALGIPDPGGAELDALFATFAPEFVVDTAGDADIPGELGWRDDGAPGVISRLPVVYRRVSHARYAGRPLLQLNYWIWFPERPLGAGWDILGGRLDGLLWRVTLAPDGAPWVFDTIHPCGCYHLFFPTALAALKAQPDTLDESAFVPQALPRIEPGARVSMRLESGTHYVQRVLVGSAATQGAAQYSFADDDVLRSLPLAGGGRRGVFRPDGIIPGTERGERWLFWPMGVPEPGAMRQWGRHATAFVGRRHFDDPGLLERYFTLEGVSRE